ncbi:MAG: hypothetical protein E7D69_16890 [Clostridium celatum]|nr:hypothetical protein [Clostridium celatum]
MDILAIVSRKEILKVLSKNIETLVNKKDYSSVVEIDKKLEEL